MSFLKGVEGVEAEGGGGVIFAFVFIYLSWLPTSNFFFF